MIIGSSERVPLEKCPALVLNADFRPLSYYPLSLWCWQDAVKSVFLERVSIVSNYERKIRSPSFEMSLQVGLKKIQQINCLIGYSGKVINQKHLSNNINSKPKIFLMHGENDEIVSPTHLLEAKEYLKKHSVNVKTKLFKNCEHRIPVEGTSLGLDFLKKNLL